MASRQQLKRRIGSVKNTKQITKAMELVSASKMRRAQESATKGRDYSDLAVQILSRLRELTDVTKHYLYDIRDVKNKLYIVVTSDRGLAGAYNSNVLKAFLTAVKDDQQNGISVNVITIGRQAANFVSKLDKIESSGAYVNFPDNPTANDLRPIIDTAVSGFGKKTIDQVEVVFTKYKSSVLQEVTRTTLLPAAFTDVETDFLQEATFEPDPLAVLDSVTQRFIEVLLYQAVLESQASEQSARMMAMKNATDNATDLINDLTLAFNTARQAAITQELAEITGGAEAIK